MLSTWLKIGQLVLETASIHFVHASVGYWIFLVFDVFSA